MDFQNFFETLKWSMMINVTIIDYIQMFILTGIIFYLFKTLYKTRAWVLIKGLITIGIIYVIICVTNMTVLRSVMEKLFSVAAIAIVIMFQPDLHKLAGRRYGYTESLRKGNASFRKTHERRYPFGNRV